MNIDILVACIGLFGVILTSIITFYVTRKNTKQEFYKGREQYVDDKLKEIIDIYQKEVKSLRDEVQKLTRENIKLRDEVIDLKNRVLEDKPKPTPRRKCPPKNT
jgi:regulator of replication initiation timing